MGIINLISAILARSRGTLHAMPWLPLEVTQRSPLMLMPGLALLVTRNLTRRKELAWYEDFHRDACLLGRERSARAPHAAGLCRYSQAAKALTQVQL